MPEIGALGHVGVYADDLMKQWEFYTRVMGLKVADEDLEGRGMIFLSADPEREHHEFVLMKGRASSDDAKVIQQISFIVPTIDDLRDFYHRLQGENVEIDRIVSHGNALGMYFFDPEGNRIELYYKTGFPMPQPTASPSTLMPPTRSCWPSPDPPSRPPKGWATVAAEMASFAVGIVRGG